MLRDAHQWLPRGQQEEWVQAKGQAVPLVFASFAAFTLLSRLSLRILQRKGRTIKDPGNQVLLRHGSASLTHAVLSLMASFYILMRRGLSHCGERAFCHDDLSARLWTVHGGYCLFELLFWQTNGSVVQPWNEMVLLNDVVLLLMAFASLLYPSRLSLTLLPFQQLLQLAPLVDCVRRFVSVYGAPWHVRFKVYLAFMAVHTAKAAGATALAAYTFYYIRRVGLWTLELPEGMSALNQVYGMIFLAGGVVLAMIYVKWCGAAIELTNQLISQVQRGHSMAGASAPPAGKKTSAQNGRRRSERQRR